MITSPCIPSINKPNPTHGYAPKTVNGRKTYEHTLAWEEVNGPVPVGMVLDHLCHDPKVCKGGKTCPHRACRNPEHLAPVTRGENVSRERSYRKPLVTHCPKNHPYDETNTYVDPQGRRHCRACTRESIRAHNARRRAERVPVQRAKGWRYSNDGTALECARGHDLTLIGAIYLSPTDLGKRECRVCRNERAQAWRSGQAWDNAADEPVSCACGDESHGGA